MNREMRRMLNKNTKGLVSALENEGIRLDESLFKSIDLKSISKNPNKLLDVARQLKEKTGKLEALLSKSDEFQAKPKVPPELKINIK